MAGLNGKFGVGLLTKNTMHLMSKKNPFNSLCIALVDSASSVIVYYCFGALFERTNIFILFNSYFTSLNAAMLDIWNNRYVWDVCTFLKKISKDLQKIVFRLPWNILFQEEIKLEIHRTEASHQSESRLPDPHLPRVVKATLTQWKISQFDWTLRELQEIVVSQLVGYKVGALLFFYILCRRRRRTQLYLSIVIIKSNFMPA